jgi:hypothetical protein
MESEIDATPAPGTGSTRAALRPGGWNPWLLGCWLIVVIVFACLRARSRPLWYDELFTFYIAQVPSVSDLWTVLASGTDLNPPLHYLAVRGMFQTFGASALAQRLPSVFGYAIMSLCVYAYVARRLAPAFAWAAATFPLLTQAYSYAYEGRPYGIVLGCCGLALLAWQGATDGVQRLPGLALLPLVLASAVSIHFFAVLIFVPIGLGELARAWSRRRIDLRIWVALLLGLVPLLFFGDLIRASSLYKGSFWSKPTWAQNVAFYLSLFKDTGVPLLFAFALLVLASRFGRPARGVAAAEARELRDSVPLHEWVAMIGLLALPIIGFVVAKVASGGAFTERYALSTVLGFGLLIAYGTDRFAAGRACPARLLALAFFAWFVLYEGYQLRPAREPHLRVSESDFRRAGGSDLPIVISRSVLYLQSYHDLPRHLSERLVFISVNRSTDEIALKSLSRWVPLKVADVRQFLAAHDRFFLCGYPGDVFFRTLLEGNARLTMLQSRRYREGEAVLVRVEIPKGGVSVEAGADARQ